MKTVHEVSKLTGVSIRTLQYYDKIGLLSPAERTAAGYRLYDDTALERLQQILLFRELEFPLTEIKTILSSPDFDRDKALSQQIELLTLKKERLEGIIHLARELQSKQKGEAIMDFNAFDTKQLDEYAERAKKEWGDTKEYAEFSEKESRRTKEDGKMIAADFMKLYEAFGRLRDLAADSAEVKAMVEKLQSFITEHYYHCSDEILFSLGQMYAGDGEFRQNIDKAGGEGTAEFVSRAIAVYCER